MDRESLKPKAHENTQSGTDDEVAQDADAAFNPRKTDPDSAMESAERKHDEQAREGEREREGRDGDGDGGGAGPLEKSPANRDFAAQTTGAREDRRPGGGGDGRKPSAGGSPPKKGKV